MNKTITSQKRLDHDVLSTDTRRIRVLGPRTVQETRSSHWYGYTVSARTREPGGEWSEIHREDLRGPERWDRTAVNKLGGLGALVTDAPPDAELQAAIARAFEAIGENPGSYQHGQYFAG